ncbi:hypothetical protein HMPREF0072_0821 [Anaerococcus lactolyticus ATCC 51172]|uniref:DUF4209 domain-containing protein n=1 Tax=Anaerococcus lactolyticus ATCC 51172 TaxID=525254 RepID=C2BEQ1_9FIRM|nr:hypothetical protein [Anaerococcus lactolyticus]EEI86563.1 hypothetical protein HMPREF0072_0821 [Anaerococcus lactolyticus ATCC 51172]
MSEVKYKNYLDHEIHVKFVEGILEQSQSWQWFIEYIEDNYNLSDVGSYIEYQNRSNSLIRILRNFTNILEVCDFNFQFRTILLQEIYEISKYYVGATERENCEKNVSSEFSKVLLLSVWLTKLQNSGNKSKYIIDNRFMNQRNFHQALNMQEFDYDKEEIILYLEKIKLKDFGRIKRNIEDNLNRVVYGLSENFFEKYGDKLLSENCFNFQSFDRGTNLTWQEDTLLDMIQISIRNGEVIPMYSNGDIIVPNYKDWTPDLLKQLKNYFNNRISDFVIESVDFLLNQKAPNIETIEDHCNLFLELISKGEDYEILTSSTYEILTMLFDQGAMDRIDKTEVIKEFYKSLHSITSVNLLMRLRSSFPLHRDQIQSVKDYIENEYRTILDINDIPNLTQYLKNIDIARYINQIYYDETKDRFLKLIKDVNDTLVANIFYHAMLFLISVNQTNQIVDKRIVKQDMINLQEYWEKSKYQEQVKNLQEFTYCTQISTEEVEKYNKSILENPIIVANSTVLAKVDDLISVLERTSNHSLMYMVNRIEINNIFPIKDTGINFDRHETDNILRKQVEKIIEKYGYKFINILDADIYVSAMHDTYINNVYFVINLFNKEKELYELLEKIIGVRLIPFNEQISLGHLTQLFPLLEIEIRKLGKLFGIVPFKENVREFMKFKDPSSILRELIEDVYEELDGLESAPDLLFVYHFMYNSNSLNIRNECIHGRDYFEGYMLKFAFKVTMLALYMIRYRINSILTNSNSYNEV